MKIFTYTLIYIAAIAGPLCRGAEGGAVVAANGAPAAVTLHEGWRMCQARVGVWHMATVPGVVHTDLMEAGIIEDPFTGLNERGVQWIDKEDWIYVTRFDAPDNIFEKNNIRLTFKGLDTYADVDLNGERIISADNMFREWRAGVKGVLKHKGNVLMITFRSPIREVMPLWEALPFRYRGSNDQSHNGGVFDRELSVFTRKAGYHYGWDWGPRLVTSGIWRPVLLEGWDGARIDDVHIIQRNVTARSASLVFAVEALSDGPVAGVQLTVTERGSGRALARATVDLQTGLNRAEVPVTIRNPRLWWSNGLGEQHLYDFEVTLSSADREIDSRRQRTGLRSLKLVRQPDAAGESFYFELNGIPVFAKGANYIPCDNFLPRVGDSTYRRVVGDAAAANMNMLRVWGGGVYEDDAFYDLCDRLGIMVWQDFMFSCSVYPASGHMLENIRREAVDNVRRLRNHPSIALWCGNNECLEAWFHWGWKRRYEDQNQQYADTVWQQFRDQYFKVLPQVVAQHDPMGYYTPSSPFAGEDGRRDPGYGDAHFWGVWHGRQPTSDYNKVRSRFFSEYGFQSFPEFSTVRRYAPSPGEWDTASETMLWHQRGGRHANSLINTYLKAEYGTPCDFRSMLYMTHLLQGDAVRTAIEAHRRDMPSCMGSLYWQLNDCWPVASWSGRDCYGRWKALHYFARKAFDDVLVSPVAGGDTLEVFVVSDRRRSFDARLTLRTVTMDGREVWQRSVAVKVPSNGSHRHLSVPLEELLHGHGCGGAVVEVSLVENKGREYTNIYYPALHKDMNYPAAEVGVELEAAQGGAVAVLSCDVFARGVCLSSDGGECAFSDNYFDLLPGRAVRVRIGTTLDVATLRERLRVATLDQARTHSVF